MKVGAMSVSGAIDVARREGSLTARRATNGAIGRLRAGWWPVVQTAVAVALAWSAAALILGNDRPFVAAIAAVISIGAVAGQTLRRAIEWTFGVAVGLFVADLIMIAIGTGPIQTGIMVGLAMMVALLIRGGIMFWTEVGVSAILVAGLDPTTAGTSPDRFVEALLGGGVALVVSGLFPSNPSLRARVAARPVLRELATVLRDSAVALLGGNLEQAQLALDDARRMDEPMARLREELDGGHEIARLSPSRRGHLRPMEHYATVAEQLDRAGRNTRVLARAVEMTVREGRETSPQLVEAILELALAVEALGWHMDRPEHHLEVRQYALGAAEEATSTLHTRSDLETSMLVGQVRATAIDLLQAAGLDPTEAYAALANRAPSPGLATGRDPQNPR